MKTKYTVLITGGSSGIGLETARQMQKDGYTVVICGRSREELELVKKANPGLVTFPCDVTLAKDRQNLFRFMEKEHPQMDILVNNAGIAKRFWFQDIPNPEETIMEEWMVNYLAPIAMIKIFHGLLKKNHGTIINISSGLALVPLSVQPNYCATKAVLHSMTQSLRFKFKDDDIKVLEVFPPAVDTPFQQGNAPDNAISPELAARILTQQFYSVKEEIYIKRAAVLRKLSRIMPMRAFAIMNVSIPAGAREILKKKYGNKESK